MEPTDAIDAVRAWASGGDPSATGQDIEALGRLLDALALRAGANPGDLRSAVLTSDPAFESHEARAFIRVWDWVQSTGVPGEVPRDVQAEARGLARALAVKRIRQATGWVLKDAKDYVDSLLAEDQQQPVPDIISAAGRAEGHTSTEQDRQLVVALLADERVRARLFDFDDLLYDEARSAVSRVVAGATVYTDEVHALLLAYDLATGAKDERKARRLVALRRELEELERELAWEV